MKKLFLLPLFLIPSAQATDCYHCSLWNYWEEWFPVISIPEWPFEYIKVEKVDYKRNEKATYCTRPVEIIDTIVLHHSGSPSTSTSQEINNYHVNRSSGGDPWYMIGYSYVINSPYQGMKVPTPKVSEGRPLEIVGSHAGSDAYVPMDEEQKKMWDEKKIVCGKSGETFAVDPKQVKDGKIKANVTTLGVVVLGNYAPFSKWNPGGYAPGKPRYPTKQTLEMAAKLSCQLQKKYPRMTKLHWHSMYNATDCPGNLKQNVEEIKKIAKGLGCNFN